MGSSGSNATYWSGVSAQSTAQGSTNASGLFTDALNRTNANLGFQNTIISSITTMSTWKSSCGTGGLSATLSSYLASAQSAKASDTTVLNTINTFQADYAALGSGDTTLISKYGGASVLEAQLALINKYNAYVASGIIPTIDTNITLETTTVPAVSKEISTLQQFYESTCQTAP
jgi:hypothetical protein